MSRTLKMVGQAGFVTVALFALASNGLTATAAPIPPPSGPVQMEDGLIKDLRWRNIGTVSYTHLTLPTILLV